MHNIDFETFNKGLYIRMSHTEKWERGKIEAIRLFLSENSPVPPEKKNELPQFIFNVEEGSRSTTLKYPQEILVTELDLPDTLKKQVESNRDLNDDWQNAEFGYMSRAELTGTDMIELDFHWTPKTIQDILLQDITMFTEKTSQMKWLCRIF